jgi:predicted permease
MGIRLLRGRVFDAADMRASAAGVAIVSASLAKRLWGDGENPVGKRIHVPNARMQWSTVVGVAGDVRHAALDEEDTRAIYVPEEDWSWASTDAVLVARVRGDLGATLKNIRAAVAALDPTQPITNIRSMDAVVSSSTTQRQLALTLFAAFAILAVLLSAAGIYGVLAGSVAERTREIGVRSALGATPRDLLRMVLRRGLWLAGMGVVLGLAGAFAVTRYLHALLFGIAPTDAAVFASAAALLLGVALVACLVPARRAVRVDPMVALRE